MSVRSSIALRFVALTFAVALAVLPLATRPSARAATADLPYRLEPAMTSSIGVNQRKLVASGSLIVWQDSRSGTPDVYAYDLDDGREFRVASSAGYRAQPAISGARVVWVGGAEAGKRVIEGVDLNQGRTLTVTDQPGDVADPAIDGDLVVWRARSGPGWEIRGKNLLTGDTLNITDDAANQAHPTISGGMVVWQEYHDGNWDIMRYDVAAKRVTAVTATPDDETSPALAGDDLAFIRQPQAGGAPQLILRNVKTGAQTVVVSDHLVMQPSIANGVLAWEDWRTGLPDVYAYDIAQKATFAIVRSQQAYDPAVSERGVAWISRSDLTRGRIQSIAFIKRLPTDAQEPPAVPSPDHVYVPETKHFMSAGFKSFWQSHGGPQVLGFPLTEEFTEKDPKTGENVTVQYFQRAKLEYRASAPEGQRIGLARLGAELTTDRQFAPVAPFESGDNKVYFSQTGHSLAYGFKEFWDANGGLAVFGFPISEEFTENGHTVQYFERARFEFNPNAQDQRYKVELGLLGQEALQRKGWLPRPPIDTTMVTE